MFASCGMRPEPRCLKGVRAPGSAFRRSRGGSNIARLEASFPQSPTYPPAPNASSPITLTGSARQLDEVFRGEVNSGRRRDEAAENRGTSGRKREEPVAGSGGFSPRLHIQRREAEPKHLFLVVNEREGREAERKCLFFIDFNRKTMKNRQEK